ncbi:MAG: hypothetical protein ACUVUR_07705 [bacterium]
MGVEEQVLFALLKEPNSSATVKTLARKLGLDQSLIMAAGVRLKETGFLEIEEQTYDELTRGREWSKKLPERLALEKTGEAPTIAIALLPHLLQLEDVRSIVKWLTKKGWFTRERDHLTLTEKGKMALSGKVEPY